MTDISGKDGASMGTFLAIVLAMVFIFSAGSAVVFAPARAMEVGASATEPTAPAIFGPLNVPSPMSEEGSDGAATAQDGETLWAPDRTDLSTLNSIIHEKDGEWTLDRAQASDADGSSEQAGATADNDVAAQRQLSELLKDTQPRLGAGANGAKSAGLRLLSDDAPIGSDSAPGPAEPNAGPLRIFWYDDFEESTYSGSFCEYLTGQGHTVTYQNDDSGFYDAATMVSSYDVIVAEHTCGGGTIYNLDQWFAAGKGYVALLGGGMYNDPPQDDYIMTLLGVGTDGYSGSGWGPGELTWTDTSSPIHSTPNSGFDITAIPWGQNNYYVDIIGGHTVISGSSGAVLQTRDGVEGNGKIAYWGSNYHVSDGDTTSPNIRQLVENMIVWSAADLVDIGPSQGGRASPNSTVQYNLTVYNYQWINDTIDLTTASVPHGWGVQLFAGDGVTPLTDADGDAVLDAGNISANSTAQIVVNVIVPIDAPVGSLETTTITVRSSWDTNVNGSAELMTWLPITPPFYDDFEEAGGYSTAQNNVGPGAVWEWGNPSPYDAGPMFAHSSSKCWGTNLLGPYGWGADCLLELPVCDFSAMSSVQLSFWHWYNIDGNYWTDDVEDGGWVEVSTDGGMSWGQVYPSEGYNDYTGDIPPDYGDYVPCYAGYSPMNSAPWVKARFDLSSYAGMSDVYVRFRFWSEPWDEAEWWPGWYIDDLAITELPTYDCLILPEYMANYGWSSDVHYYFQLRNQGLYDDTFDLSATWGRFPVTFFDAGTDEPITSVGPLAPEEDVYFGVTVRFPPDARNDEFDYATIFATSQGDPSVISSAIAQSTFRTGINVAIYDHGDSSDISYWYGGVGNSWSDYQWTLDDDGRFNTVILTDLSAASLAGVDALVLPDNAVPDEFLDEVNEWFVPGHGIIAADSAACFAAYSGYLFPQCRGTNGYSEGWEYGSLDWDQEITYWHKITEDYSVGSVYNSYEDDAQFYDTGLPGDAIQLTRSFSNNPMIYAAARTVPGHGRIVGLGPYDSVPGGLEDLVCDAVEWSTNYERISVMPSPQTGYGQPNGDVDYTFTVKNDGYDSDTGWDTYHLTVATGGWGAMFYDTDGVTPITSISLPVGASADFIVRVTIPPGATPGSFDDMSVAFTSEYDGWVTGFCSVRTQVPYETNWYEGFEGGWDGWTTTHIDPANPSVNWEIGDPMGNGPGSAWDGTQCAGTNLNSGVYAAQSDIVLESPYVYMSQPIYRVLIVSPDPTMGGSIANILGVLGAYPDLSVTVWDYTTYGNPSFADMIAYDVVIVGNDYLWGTLDKNTVGNVLADYIDAGGKVIETEYVQSYDAWGFGGRYMADGYSPFAGTTLDNWNPDSIAITAPAHPVMAGVTAINDGFGQQDPSLRAGATLLATWSGTGYNAIACNDNVVAINMLLMAASSFSGDVGTLLHNAIVYLTPPLAVGNSLSFYHWYSMDTMNEDGSFVELSVDNGPWTQIDPTMGYPASGYLGGYNTDGYSGLSGGTWAYEEYDLSAYTDETVRFRFHFASTGDYSDAGWYIDGIYVGGSPMGCSLAPLALSGYGVLGADVNYTLTLSNDGFFPDTYALSATSLWPTTFYDFGLNPITSLGPMMPGTSVPFIVRVSVPFAEIPGTTDYAAVMASSMSNPLHFAEADVDTMSTVALPFIDDMESGRGGWASEDWIGTSGTAWELGNPDGGVGPSAHSPWNCWGTNLQTNYGDNSAVMLTSPPLDTTGAGTVYLTFQSWLDVEPYADFGFVTVSTDQMTWYLVNPEVSQPLQETSMGPLGFTGSYEQWNTVVCDISLYTGGPLWVGFYFSSSAGMALPNHPGWYIDDVNVFIPGINGCVLTPDETALPGIPGSTVDYLLTVHNPGTAIDTYDLSSTSVWPVVFRDLADTMDITTVTATNYLGSESFIARVTVPGGIADDVFDVATITATSQTDNTITDTATIKTVGPISPPWLSDFESGTLAGATGADWTPSDPTAAGVGSVAVPSSGTNYMYLSADFNTVTSLPINTSSYGSVIVSCWIQRDMYIDSPEAGDDLFLQYLNDVGTWVGLDTFTGAGAPGEIFTPTYVIPAADAQHRGFTLRFTVTCDDGAFSDYWLIDDVRVTGPYRCDFVPSTVQKSGPSPSTVFYMLTLLNTGVLDDNYTLTKVEDWWPVTIYDLSGTDIITYTGLVPSGTSFSFLVKVDINSGENPGTTDWARAIATSMNDTSISSKCTLKTVTSAPILLVDDDSGLSTQWWFTGALSDMGYQFNLWEVAALGSPTASDLGPYRVVIWATGNNNGMVPGDTLSPAERAAIETYLNGGGRLYVSSGGLGFDGFFNSWSGWINQYLGADAYGGMPGLPWDAAGVPGDPIGDGLALMIHQGDYCPDLLGYITLNDLVGPSVTAIFDTPPDMEHIAVRMSTPRYRTVYTAFDFADVDGYETRNMLMDRILTWLLLPYEMVLAPEYQEMAARPGDTVIYPMEVWNFGLVADNFDLAASSTAFPSSVRDAAGTVVITQTGVLLPGQSFNFTVAVAIPGGAMPGTFDPALLTATSQGYPALSKGSGLLTYVLVDPGYSDDFEGAQPGLRTEDQSLNPGTIWELGDPTPFAYGPGAANSSDNCWGTNLLANYTWGADCLLYLPYVDLTMVETATLSFWQWYTIDGTFISADMEDGGWLEASSNYGRTWDHMSPVGGYNDFTGDVPPGYPILTSCYAGITGAWERASFDLSGYAGSTVNLRLRFWSEPWVEDGFPGWYVDDVQINATYPNYGVLLSPSWNFSYADAGTSAVYRINATNTGTAGPDTYDLSALSSQGWTYNFYDLAMNPITQVGPINYGESQGFLVEVQVPGGTPATTLDQTMAIAISQNDPSGTPANDGAQVNTEVPTPPPAPTAIETSPPNGDTNVPTWQNVTVVFSETMNPAIPPTLTQTTGTDPGGWTGLGWSTTYNTDDTYAWSHNLWTNSETVGFDVEDAENPEGTPVTLYSWSFDTVAAGANYANATGPIGGPTNNPAVTVTYVIFGGAPFVDLYYTTDVVPPYTWTWFAQDGATGSYAWTLPADGVYGWLARINASEPAPTALDAPEAAPYIYTTVPPTILSTSPANGQINVPANASVSIVYSTGMNSSLQPNLTQLGGVPVAYAFAGWSTTNLPNDTAVWTHATNWTNNDVVTLRTENGTDGAGNVQAGYFMWAFTTIALPGATVFSPQSSGTTIGDPPILYTYEGAPTSVGIYYSNNNGTTWQLWGNDATVDGVWFPPTSLPVPGRYFWNARAYGLVNEAAPAGGASEEFGPYVFDNEPPTTSVDPIVPFWQTNASASVIINVTASDYPMGVASVELWYSYNPSNVSWSNWTLFNTSTSAPWQWNFTFPDGEGYYRFYSRGNDTLGNYEAPPATYDAECGFDRTAPASSVNAISPYWHTAGPVTIEATASDGVDGINGVELWFSSSANNVTFGAYTMVGLDSVAPWSWSFTFPNSEGYYRFYSRAYDGAGNYEGAPGTQDALCALDTMTPTSSVNALDPYWRTLSPIRLTGTVNETLGNQAIQTVELWYSWSPDNTTWDVYKHFANDSAAPWEWDFNFTSGQGFYRFYSRALDKAGHYEDAPAGYDALCAYDYTNPVVTVTSPAFVTALTFNVNWTASDANGITFSNLYFTSNGGRSYQQYPGSFTATPISFTAAADGAYGFYVVAHDPAGNHRPVPVGLFTPDSTTIVDTTPPTVTGRPTGLALVTTTIRASFSEPVDNASAEAAFSISPAVSGTFSWDAANTVLTFRPAANLTYGTNYVVTIGTGVRDTHSLSMSSAYSWNFATVPPGNGIVEGYVTDTVGAPIVNATVAVQGTSLKAVTNRTGWYRIANVPAGEQTLAVNATGYDSNTALSTINTNLTTRTDIQLAKKAEGIGDWWWVALLFIIVLAAIVLIVLLLRRKKPAEQPGEPPADSEMPPYELQGAPPEKDMYGDLEKIEKGRGTQ